MSTLVSPICRAGILLAALLAGCAVTPAPEPATGQAMPSCQAIAVQDSLPGSWLAIHSRKGIAGEMRTLINLDMDGSMRYEEQLKRKGKPSQGLSESGCWQREGDALVLRTLHSNGAPVNLDDPIFINRFRILVQETDLLRLESAHGQVLNARRVSAGYRLPF